LQKLLLRQQYRKIQNRIKAEKNVFSHLVLLALKHEISMERMLCFPLGPVSRSQATSDGMPVKTEKSKLLHFLESDYQTAERPGEGSIDEGFKRLEKVYVKREKQRKT
jgi:hypothetical protein